MKKVLLTLLAIILVLGLFAAIGYAGYRFGYVQGARAAANADAPRPAPALRPFDNFDQPRMPMHNFGDDFDRGFHRGFRFGGFPMMGFGFFSPLIFLGNILVFALVIWFVYWLLGRSGWQLTRTTQTTTTTSTTPPNVEVEKGNQNTEADQ